MPLCGRHVVAAAGLEAYLKAHASAGVLVRAGTAPAGATYGTKPDSYGTSATISVGSKQRLVLIGDARGSAKVTWPGRIKSSGNLTIFRIAMKNLKASVRTVTMPYRCWRGGG